MTHQNILHFIKMQGLGNDFVLIDKQTQAFEANTTTIQAICNRHLGIGCDQVLVIDHNTDAANNHFNYHIYNADGSKAEQCGNGARCVAHYLYDTYSLKTDNIILQTENRHIEVFKKEDLFSVNMGKPEFGPLDTSLNVLPVSMGNPHAVRIVENLKDAPVEEVGKQFNSQHPYFPQGVNVGFMEILDTHHASLRVYERGVGETLACGSGACAAAVAGIVQGLLESPVTVHLKGGKLLIEWAEKDQALWLTGPAIKVFEGKYYF